MLAKSCLSAAFGALFLLHQAHAGALLDFRGKPVLSGAKPSRVVALMPSLAEMAVDVGAGGRLVGTPDYSNIPKEFEGKIKHLGPYNNLSPDEIYAVHPDLVLASMDGNDQRAVQKLENLGLRVVTLNTQSLADILRSFEIVSAALGERENAQAARMRAFFNSKRQARKRSAGRVFVQIGWSPIVTISKMTFIDDLVRLAGGINVFEDSRIKYPRPNPEEVILRNPDVILICQLTHDGGAEKAARDFWLRFKDLNAVKAKRVHIVPGDWLTKPNMSLIQGMAALEKLL